MGNGKGTQITDDMYSSIRDFVDAVDVSENFLYRKDGYIMAYLRVYSYNLNLLTKPERQAKTKNLSASFKDDRKDFVYFTLPREIDLDKYKGHLKNLYQEEMKLGKRHILAGMLIEATVLSTSGENFEHQHFIKIWRKGKEKKTVETELLERIQDFRTRFAGAGINTEILEEPEIIKLCNLFGNSLQASYESTDKTAIYTPIMQIQG